MTGADTMSDNRCPLDDVQARSFAIAELPLACGETLRDVRIAYEVYGTLAADRRNVVLLTHGYTSHQHMAGRYREGHAPPGLDAGTPGNWPQLVGPGLAIDTDRCCVVSSNMTDPKPSAMASSTSSGRSA
jgi:homoserine O-acetyltransferase